MRLGTAHVIRADARSLPLPDDSDCPGHEPAWEREGDVWRAVPGEEEP